MMSTGIALIVLGLVFVLNNALVLGFENSKKHKSTAVVVTSTVFLVFSSLLVVLGIVYAGMKI
jgi:hypothetical protein